MLIKVYMSEYYRTSELDKILRNISVPTTDQNVDYNYN